MKLEPKLPQPDARSISPSRLRRIFPLLVCSLLGGALAASAQAPVPEPAADLAVVPPPLPDPIPEGARVGQVRVVASDIFDPNKPGENNWIFRLANLVHLETRPAVLTRQLLFKTGDPFVPERLEESERILRQNAYLYDAKIHPVAYHDDGTVDVEVVTRDVWTLNLGAGFSRAGGKNFTSFQIEDSNFLGTGKEVSVLRTSDIDRISNVFRYRDPNLLGSRWQMETGYADNSDGRRGRFDLERPFFSLDTRWSARLRGIRDTRELSLYELGKAFQTFRRRQDFLEVQGGLSRGLVAGRAHRLRFGFTYERDRFEGLPIAGLDLKGGSGAVFPIPNRQPPPPRTLSFPWIALDSVDDGYIEEKDLNRIERTEDLNLGRQTHFRLGYSSPSFGGDRNQALGEASGSAGWKPTPRQLLLTSGGVATRYGGGGIVDLAASLRLRYSVRTFGRNLFVAALYADTLHNPDADHQLLLGGENGLRGYPIRIQAGDRRLLLTLEQRFYWDRELFHLAHLGAAVFFDAGQAWFVESRSIQERELLKDVGLGLRVASSRSARGAVIHLDVAFPLDRGRGSDRIQYLVSTQESF